MDDLYDRIKSGAVRVTICSLPLFRFWWKTNKNGPIHPVHGQCWQWNGSTTDRGYGQFCVNYQNLRTHRWAYEEFVGKITDGLHVLHKCDNPSCVNPAHLFLGTHDDNQKDKTAKGRQAKGVRNGQHKLTRAQIDLIRKQYAKRRGFRDPIYGQGALARRFGVTQANISYIVLGKTWK